MPGVIIQSDCRLGRLKTRNISANTAWRLGVFFWLPAQFRLNLQNDFDLRLAKSADLVKIKPFRAA
jgi:plasmid maintenance system antidote protein VapI